MPERVMDFLIVTQETERQGFKSNTPVSNPIFLWLHQAIYLFFFKKTCNSTIKFIFGKCTEHTVPTTFWKIVVKEFPCFLQLTSRIVYMSFHLIAQSQRDLSEPQHCKWELPKRKWMLSDRWLIARMCWLMPCFLLEGSMSQKMHFSFYFTQRRYKRVWSRR